MIPEIADAARAGVRHRIAGRGGDGNWRSPATKLATRRRPHDVVVIDILEVQSARVLAVRREDTSFIRRYGDKIVSVETPLQIVEATKLGGMLVVVERIRSKPQKMTIACNPMEVTDRTVC